MTMDKKSEGADLSDTLYVDVNDNETIDEGEVFPLKLQSTDDSREPGSFSNPLVARKVPLASPGNGKAQRFVNLSLSVSGPRLFIGTAPWGNMKGKGTLGGRDCEVVLHDGDADGSFDGFEGGVESIGNRQQSDVFSVTFDGGASGSSQSLRRKMIVGGSTYRVSLSDEGARIAFEPVETLFGTVAAAGDGMDILLSNPEWGAHTVRSGKEKSLPAGIYRITTFSRFQGEPYASCRYKGHEGMEVRVETDGRTDIELDTVLRAEVETRRSRSNLILSLQMATSQGAQFSGYSQRQYPTDPPGVSFFITDSAGEVLVNDYFRFG
jgi:hypothetical protein